MSAQEYVNVVSINFEFQKDQYDNKRVIIKTFSTDASYFFDTYAGSIPYSALKYENPLGKAIVNNKVAKYLEELTGNKYNDTGLDMQIYVDENHKYNKYSSYLFINENEEIVETPIIYKNDRVLLGIQHFMNFEVIVRLPLGGEFIVDESYQKLFTNFIK